MFAFFHNLHFITFSSFFLSFLFFPFFSFSLLNGHRKLSIFCSGMSVKSKTNGDGSLPMQPSTPTPHVASLLKGQYACF